MAKPSVRKKTSGMKPRPPQAVAARVAGASMGLALSGPGDAVNAVKRGLPIACVDDLRKSLGVSQQILGRVTNMSERTIIRRKAERGGRLKTDESERVLRIGLLFDRTVAALGGTEEARAWLSAPSRALGGKTPLDFADTEPGAREVEHLLGRIEHGVFS
jgi:putative toxin-antitoxin system antitoxin component (TIGR02293 family)